MFSEIVKTSFNLWWKNKKLWIIAFIAYLAIYSSTDQNISEQITKRGNTPEVASLLLVIGLVTMFIGIISFIYNLTIGQIASNGLLLAYRDLDAGKVIGGVKEVFKSGVKHWGRMILLSLVFSIPIFITAFIALVFIIIVAASSGIAVSEISSSSASTVLAGMGAILIPLCCCLSVVLIVLFIGWIIHLSFASRVLILEDKGVMDSIKISFNLIKNNFWKVIGAFFVEVGLMIILMLVLAIPGIMIAVIFGIGSVALQLAVIELGLKMPLLGGLIFFGLQVITILFYGIFTGLTSSFSQAYWNSVYLKLSKASNHLVNGEPEKESFGPFVDSKPVESQVPSGL